MVWKCASPKNSYVEISVPYVMVLGGGASGKWLGHEEGAHINGISVLVREAPQSSLNSSPCEGAVRRHRLRTGKKSSPECNHAADLTLDFQSSELWDTNFCSQATWFMVFLCSSLNGLGHQLHLFQWEACLQRPSLWCRSEEELRDLIFNEINYIWFCNRRKKRPVILYHHN